MNKPSMYDIAEFFEARFGRKVDRYFLQWVDRFSSPKVVWSYADTETRKILRDMFPIFYDINLDENLNNPKWVLKFNSWD